MLSSGDSQSPNDVGRPTLSAAGGWDELPCKENLLLGTVGIGLPHGQTLSSWNQIDQQLEFAPGLGLATGKADLNPTTTGLRPNPT